MKCKRGGLRPSVYQACCDESNVTPQAILSRNAANALALIRRERRIFQTVENDREKSLSNGAPCPRAGNASSKSLAHHQFDFMDCQR
jgi:hypothetical protein